jgi:hypothetical protein
MMKQNQSVKPVDPSSLRGLSSHAETHWLTFATALKCYAQCPTRPEIRRAIDRHAPPWLRGALQEERRGPRSLERPRELDPKTGSLAFLTRGAEASMHPPQDLARALPSAAREEHAEVDSKYQDRLERYLSLAAARADVTRRVG